MTYEGNGIYSFYSSSGEKIKLTEDDIREIQQHQFPFMATLKKNNPRHEIVELYFAYKDNFKNMTFKSLCEYIALNVSGKKITWHAVKKQIYKYKLNQFNNLGEFIYQEMQKNKHID
ncbi:MAG: hypothetical protein Q8J85_04700 [Sulfuricurvum sp.]|nr:hypothetical protein [Sulfuricurvum sp.]MDP3022704.1 hypothetical protein [Sulfuricurvum sp.]